MKIESERAQRTLDVQEKSARDIISRVMELKNSDEMTREDAYDLFMARHRLVRIRLARAGGYGLFHYVRLQDLPAAKKLIDQYGDIDARVDLEPKRRVRKQLKAEALSARLALLGMCQEEWVGEPGIELLEYEADADSYVPPSSTDKLWQVERFVSDWVEFKKEHAL